MKAAEREALEALIRSLETEKSDTNKTIELQASEIQDLKIAHDEEAAKLIEAAAAAELRKRLEEADAELTAMTLILEEEENVQRTPLRCGSCRCS